MVKILLCEALRTSIELKASMSSAEIFVISFQDKSSSVSCSRLSTTLGSMFEIELLERLSVLNFGVDLRKSGTKILRRSLDHNILIVHQ